MKDDESVRLDCYDKEEWWDVARRVNPNITREEYDRQWDEFVQMKLERQRQERLQ